METRRTTRQSEENQDKSSKIFTLFVLGFFITSIGLILMPVASVLSRSSSTSFGGVIFIGSIPIVLGSGPEAQWLILFAIILTAISAIMLLAMRRKKDRTKAYDSSFSSLP